MNYLIPNDVDDSEFLYYYFCFIKDELKNLAGGGTALPILKKSLFSEIEILMPPKLIRIKIGQILNSIDEQINFLESQNKILEKIIQSIFKSWFIDFDGITEFVDSELGQIPKGWKIESIGNVAGINEKSISKNYPYDAIEYIDISSVDNGKLKDVKTIMFDDAPSRAKRIIQDKDILWSTVRPNRKSYLFINKSSSKMIASTGFAVISAKEIPASYLYSNVTTDEFVNYLAYNADGSTYPAVNPDRISEYKIIIPDETILKTYDKISSTSLENIWSNYMRIKILIKIRDSLLPKLMSGEIRV